MSEKESRALLGTMLDHDSIDAARITGIIGVRENQFLDFKSGPYRQKDAAKALRKHLCGFANAEGGSLIFGVSDLRPRTITGVDDWLDEEWTTRSSESLLSTIGAPPVSRRIDCGGTAVLVVSVGRGVALSRCIEEGEARYYMRSDESTFPLRETLVTDLILGRRRGPTLSVARAGVDCQEPIGENRHLSFFVSVDNQSISYADDLTAGIVVWSRRQQWDRQPNPELSRSVSLTKPLGEDWQAIFLDRLSASVVSPIEVKPFGTDLRLPFQATILVPSRSARISYALFLAAKGFPVQWFQCVVDWQPDTSPSTRRTLTARVTPAIHSRPKVAWEPE